MLDGKIQKQLLRDTVELKTALALAINYEKGGQNQVRFSSSQHNWSSQQTRYQNCVQLWPLAHKWNFTTQWNVP